MDTRMRHELAEHQTELSDGIGCEEAHSVHKDRKKARGNAADDSQLVCPNHLMQQYISQERCTKCIGGSPWNCMKYKCIHGSFAKSLIGSIEAWVYRKLKAYRFIDVAICPSEFLKEKLDTCPELMGKTVVMHNFVELAGITKKERTTEPYILYFGRYSKEKGISTLLKVCKKLPSIPFVFAGNGPLEEEVNKTGNVINKGFMTGQDLGELIQNAAFSVFPSECNENCPFSVMESLMYATPVIGARIGGVPELIQEGINGYLFESGNEKELWEKINDLWNCKEELDRLTEGCGKIKFDTVDKYCEKILQYYF